MSEIQCIVVLCSLRQMAYVYLPSCHYTLLYIYGYAVYFMSRPWSRFEPATVRIGTDAVNQLGDSVRYTSNSRGIRELSKHTSSLRDRQHKIRNDHRLQREKKPEATNRIHRSDNGFVTKVGGNCALKIG
ncbi:hypothetical protein QTP88_004314 [Uroleucon formosanum]